MEFPSFEKYLVRMEVGKDTPKKEETTQPMTAGAPNSPTNPTVDALSHLLAISLQKC